MEIEKEEVQVTLFTKCPGGTVVWKDCLREIDIPYQSDLNTNQIKKHWFATN